MKLNFNIKRYPITIVIKKKHQKQNQLSGFSVLKIIGSQKAHSSLSHTK